MRWALKVRNTKDLRDVSFLQKRKIVGSLIVLAAPLALAACAGPRTFAEDPSIQMVSSALPPPSRTDLLAEEREYYIGPFDKLKIDVFGIPALAQREVQLDASGRISFPLIGSVQAAGLTPSELAVEIEQRLRGQYIRDPQVTVNLEETTSQVVTVDGQVAKPGLYPVMGRMTLLRAVANAGSTGEFASLEDVVIQRTVQGQRYIALYNLQAIRQGNYQDPEVYANDVIVVGDSPGRRLFRDIISASGLITAPIVAILR